MKSIKIFGFLLLLSSLFIVSCSKENIDETNTNPGKIDVPTTTVQNSLLTRSTETAASSSSDNGLELDCVTILYSFDLIEEDGTIHTISSDEDFFNLMEDTTNFVIVDFVYPLNVQDENGETSEVASGEELGELFAMCLPNGWTDELFPAFLLEDETSCFTAEYPIDLQNIDGEIFTANDADEYIELLVQEPMFFVFPFNLIDEEGNVIAINNVDELIEALISCNDVVEPGDTTWWNDDVEYIGCYQITFPFDVVLADGTVVTVEDHMQYCDLLLSGQIVDFSYPITVIDEDGNEITVNSAEELNELLEDCDYGNGGPNIGDDIWILLEGTYPWDSTGMGCYSINYPLSLTGYDFDGNAIVEGVVMEEAGIYEFLNSNPNEVAFIGLQYPVSVTLSEDQSVVELNAIEDIFDLLEGCGN